MLVNTWIIWIILSVQKKYFVQGLKSFRRYRRQNCISFPFKNTSAMPTIYWQPCRWRRYNNKAKTSLLFPRHFHSNFSNPGIWHLSVTLGFTHKKGHFYKRRLKSCNNVPETYYWFRKNNFLKKLRGRETQIARQNEHPSDVWQGGGPPAWAAWAHRLELLPPECTLQEVGSEGRRRGTRRQL